MESKWKRKNRKRLSVDVPDPLWIALVQRSKIRNTTITHLVHRALWGYIKHETQYD